jgi:hypothetical protein
MTNSSLSLGNRSHCSAVGRSALALVVGVGLLNCGASDRIAPTVIPPPVFTTIAISTGGDSSSVAVGSAVSFWITTLDQYGRNVVVDHLDKRLSDTTIASLTTVPGQPWDYGDLDGVKGLAAGQVVLTVTAQFQGVSHSATQTIDIVSSK